MKNKLLYLIAIVLLFLPKINYGQAPTLGTAAGFVLFTSVGAITNTGISQVTGNVGSNVGASTNFGNVNGIMQSQNLATAACSTDVLSAYNQLAGTTATFFPSSSLGGDTLLPGVYSVSGASTLTNVLTLNAQGNPNAVFIFKLQGAFSAAANAKVKLINGALACNVFWKIEGLTNMATGVTMRGTIITNNAAINMSAGDTLEGRAFTTAGAISVTGVMAYTPIGCGSPFLIGPMAPPLGTTANYALFSSIGPVTNTGVTNIIGDVGTNSGLTTGFNPLLVNGVIHPIPDFSTIQCSSDLNVVYTYLNALPADIELLFPAQFGNKLVLTPHTYLLNAATALTDTLFLNGEGNPNAVFVIKIFGALSTSTYSNVVLKNGTQSRNVYWLVNGAVSINDYSVFRGTIIANNGAINFAIGSLLDGRALTTVGAVNVNAMTANAPNAPFVIIPPTAKLVCLGDTARFIVSASGTNLTYQWRKGNVNLINGLNVSGVTKDTLTIFPTTYADIASNYNVIIMGNVIPNDTTLGVALKINSPIITSEPVNKTACLGSNVTFSVTTSGIGITYQWRKGAINLINGGNIQGATSDTLKINGVTINDTAANYNVIITGVCAPKDTSNNVSLYINNTIITINPSNQTVCLGSSASFVTKASGSGLTYQWRRGNVNLVNGLNISGVTTDTLRFNSTTILDTATNYNVIISSTCSLRDTSANVSLNINLPLAININPSNQTACLGSSARFVTRATGSGLTYQWRRGNVNLVNGLNVTGVTTDTLRFNATTILDTATNYNVIISSACSLNDTSSNVSLNIITAPIITTEPINQIACAGSSVSYAASVSGNGLNYQWRKDGVDLVNGVNISGANANILTINQVALSDTSLNYYLVVTNSCGVTDTSVKVSLKVNPIPLAIASSNSPICEGKPINLVAQTVAGGTYAWSGPNGFTSSAQNPNITSALLADSGNYTLVVTQNGCNSILVNLNVIVKTCVDITLSIPEGFSPNSDGINDLFVIKGIENYPTLSVNIYNRWGSLVFEASPYLNNWNGKSNSGVTVGGDDLPIGTYFYIIDLGNGSPILKGTIYLNK
jgi:gliding motility-associated-like protein